MNRFFRRGKSLRSAGAILAFAWLATVLVALSQPAPSVPGLVAMADDGARKIVFITPTPDFTLGPNESIHPQLKPEFKAEWRGLLKIIRAGNYTLFADARVFVGEREIHAEPLSLDAGEHPLRIVFERKAGAPARLQLQWQSEHFAREPVPADALAHRGEPRELAQSAKLARGRELFESLGCASCHNAGLASVSRRSGPDLSEAAARLSAHWISKWLEDPQHFRTNTVMPTMSLMAPDRADITAFLATLRGTNTAPSEPAAASEHAAQGRELFNSIGCIACHGTNGVSLAGLGSKWTTAGRLSRYLLDPLAMNANGRMPSLDLKPDEADRLAAHLMQSRNADFEAQTLRGFDGIRLRGRVLVQYRGCLNCHSLKENGVALQNHFSAPPLKSLTVNKGCLSGRPPGDAPRYTLAAADRDALNAFIQSPDISPAPVQDFQRLVKHFNCTACHELNGPAKLTFEANQSPPPLTDAGNKLRASWLSEVLLNHKRVRPWMSLHMPHFGEAARPLVNLFAAQAGAEPGEGEKISPLPPAQLGAGVKLLGSGEGGLSCIVCHDFKGRRSVGDLRGPDMTEMHARIRGDWLRRWLRDPGRIQQGTAMPAFFSALPTAEAEQKIELLARTLAAGSNLPLPEGLDVPAQDFKLVARDEAIVFRTFIAESSPRSVAVGLPGGVSCVFDTEACRVRYAWTGGFLDVAPLWTGRGGAPAKIVGQRFYTAPNLFPLRLGGADAEPPRVAFKGYRLVKSASGSVDAVEFHFEMDGVPVKQTIANARGGLGIEMRFDLGDTAKDVWLTAAPGETATVTSPQGTFSNGRLHVPAARPASFSVVIQPK